MAAADACHVRPSTTPARRGRSLGSGSSIRTTAFTEFSRKHQRARSRSSSFSPVPLLPPLPPYYFQNALDTDGDGVPDENVVSNIWYIPVEVDLDTNGDQSPDGIPVQLTPVYVTVREL